MNSGSMSLAKSLADAVRQQAVDAGSQTPSVRGSDWRLAVVATVGSDGTITTTDGIIARRMETYLDPAAADLVVITVSGAGNWVCWGRLGSGSGSAWTTYTPTWSSTGTSPSLGNGTLFGEYTRNGDDCTAHGNLLMGSTTTYGTGEWRFLLPFPAATLAHADFHWTGSADALDRGTAWHSGVARVASAASHVMILSPTTASGGTPTEWNSGRPFTWVTNDVLSWQVTYRIA